MISAWDFRDGQLTRRWTFGSDNAGSQWTGDGNHQLSIADVDADGRHEIMYGSMAVDDNGSGLWQNNTHHGDAYHVSDVIPSRAGLEVFQTVGVDGRTNALDGRRAHRTDHLERTVLRLRHGRCGSAPPPTAPASAVRR